MAYEPTLTVYTDANPAPRVEVLFPQFAPGTATVTVYRLAENTESRLRAAVNAATAGGLSRIDFEVPFGIPVTYRAEMFDQAGTSLGFTDTASVQLDVEEAWVHHPLNPSGAVPVTMLQGAAASLSRPGQAEKFYPEQRRVAMVVSGGQRGLQGVDLRCLTRTDEDAAKFRAMIEANSVPVYCFRIPASMKMRIPRPLFAAVQNMQEIAINLHIGKSDIRWESTGDEADPPTPALIVPLLTRADLNAYYATRAALNADNLTRLAVNRRYDLAGTA
jgi:hypothetical protein